MNEIRSKIDESVQTCSDAAKELNQKRTDLSKITATSIAIDDRVSRTTVVSPVHGIVKQLKVNTIGGVVQPGSDMVEIVPLEDNLLIEAKVRPQDVAFLHPGQKAMVKFSAYDYTIYGGMSAKLELIGADTITDDKGNSFYLIQVRTDKNHLGVIKTPADHSWHDRGSGHRHRAEKRAGLLAQTGVESQNRVIARTLGHLGTDESGAAVIDAPAVVKS